MKPSGQSMYEMIASLLTGCKKYIDVEAYSKALAIIKNAKHSDHRNVYIIALEKQVKLLSDLSKQQPRNELYRKQICSTISDIIRCAIHESRIRAGTDKDTAARKDLRGGEIAPRFDTQETAIKKLLKQILRFAEEFVRKGDYKSALAELNRIYIIDPENIRAKNLEKKIETLINAGKIEQTGKRNGGYRWLPRFLIR